MGTDIPLWIGGLKKWVTGVTRQTTCEDIIRAVLAANDSSHHHHHQKPPAPRDHRRYAIVERWHKVERPLDPRCKLLKVWNTWGLEQCNVRFLLKRAHHASTASSPRDVKSHRRKVNSRASRTWHPRKLRSESEDEASCGFPDRGWDYDAEEAGFPATEEQLRNLVAAQNEALAAQLQRLRQKDEEIEAIESEVHAQRMRQIGANYVLDTYLAEGEPAPPEPSDSKKSDINDAGTCNSSTDAGGPADAAAVSSPAADIVDTCIELYEKVLQVCDQVHREEASVRELTARIRQAVRLKDEDAGGCRLLDDNPELAFAGPERLQEILERTRSDIERLLRVNSTQQQTIQQNEQTLLDCTRIIEDKHCYLQRLRADLDRLDRDNLRLQEEFQAVQVVAVDRIAATCEAPENGDSNSDTGLSSMHSSDDGATVLDTLV